MPHKSLAILTSDWHLRETVPICRTDDFFKAMEKKVDFIFSLAKEHGCPILVAGDLGHSPKWSCQLLEWFISKITKDLKIFVIPGQHDLLNHRLDSWKSCAVGVLYASEVIILLGPEDLQNSWEFDDFIIHAYPYGVLISGVKVRKGDKPHLAMIHQLVFDTQNQKWQADQGSLSSSLLKSFECFNVIHSGDNHKRFIIGGRGRWLVNPGSILRMTTDQFDHRPCIYLWDGQSCEPVYLPVEEGVVSRDHVDREEEKDQRIEAYINRLKDEVEIGLDFQSNLENYFRQNRTRKPVIDKVWEAISEK